MKLILLILVAVCLPILAQAKIQGIYLTQNTAENSHRVEYLIEQAKKTGINVFIVDYVRPSKAYTANILKIKESGIEYIPRIVVFPDGADADQVESEEYLAKKLTQVEEALELGAKEIQLDYIRYKPSQKPSDENAEKIGDVIQYFKDYLHANGASLQIDVFGISSFKPSVYIGQNLKLFAEKVDALCPMVYPSHYEPFLIHAKQPYQTVFTSITALKKQIAPNQVKVYAYIELFNYRYPMSHHARKDYIRAQLKAVKDSGANGWYAWSAGNRYDILFDVLKQDQEKMPHTLALGSVTEK